MEAWWEQTSGAALAQGDLIPGCFVPVIADDFVPPPEGGESVHAFAGEVFDLIVLTQSCDLENNKAPWVATCPVFRISDYETIHPRFSARRAWEQVRVGRFEGLHLFASPTNPEDNRQALVADFRQVFSLPIGYVATRAMQLGPRWRLRSPYVEHLSQAFARFFMRVGLPSNIPVFN